MQLRRHICVVKRTPAPVVESQVLEQRRYCMSCEHPSYFLYTAPWPATQYEAGAHHATPSMIHDRQSHTHLGARRLSEHKRQDTAVARKTYVEVLPPWRAQALVNKK